jgi:hypothetical protein
LREEGANMQRDYFRLREQGELKTHNNNNTIAVIVLVQYGTMGGIVSAIAFPHPPKDYSADELRARPDLQFLQTKSGMRIPAVHIRHPSAKFTIIYSHGNAEDVGISLYYLDIVSHVLKSSVIAYEYPGTKNFDAFVLLFKVAAVDVF